MGLALDFGYLYVMRSRLQDVADATALAGARALAKESRYAGSSGEDSTNELAVGKAIADFVSVNDAVFRNVTIDNVVYKGFYRTYENGYLNEEKEDIDAEIADSFDEKKKDLKPKKEKEPLEEIEEICRRYIPNTEGNMVKNEQSHKTKPKEIKSGSKIDVAM